MIAPGNAANAAGGSTAPPTPVIRERRQRPHFVWPALLISAGIVLLLVTAGAVDPAAAWRLLEFWPLLLVLVGVDIILSWAAPNAAARAVAAVVMLVAIIAGSLWIVLTPVSAPTTTTGNSAAVGSITAPSLAINLAGATVNLSPAALGDQLYSAQVKATGGRPTFSLDRSSQQLTVGLSNRTFFGVGHTTVDLKLNSSLPWALTVNGAGLNIKGDLSFVRVSELPVNGAGVTVSMTLGQPAGAVPVHVSGAGCTLHLNVPSGVLVVTDASGVFSTVTNRASSADVTAPDRYDITMSGVGTTLTVDQATESSS